MTKHKPRLFLDANVIIRCGKPPGGPEFSRLVDLVDAGEVTVVTTELTISEIAKKHAENNFETVKDIGRSHFRKIVEEIVGTKLPEITKTELREKLSATKTKEVKEMFKRLSADVLSIDDVKPSEVFEDYATQKGLFSGEGKKNQFADAFIFKRLELISNEDSPVIIVSDDEDFRRPCQEHETITRVKSIPDLFSMLGYEIDAPDVTEFLENDPDVLVELVDQEVNNWGLVGDVMDSEIEETKVKDVTISRLSAFRSVEESESIFAVATLLVKADVSYSHPDWDTAMYDSEDKVLIPFDDVHGETEVEFEVEASIFVGVQEDGKFDQIDMMEFRNDEFQYVTLHPSYDY